MSPHQGVKRTTSWPRRGTSVGLYLPTSLAVRGGGYSAIAESNTVGPEGGQVLADRTLDLIKSLWRDPKR